MSLGVKLCNFFQFVSFCVNFCKLCHFVCHFVCQFFSICLLLCVSLCVAISVISCQFVSFGVKLCNFFLLFQFMSIGVNLCVTLCQFVYKKFNCLIYILNLCHF